MVNIQDAMDAESMQLLGPVELGFRPTGFATGASTKNAGAILGTYICDMCVFYFLYIYIYCL